MSSLQSQSKTKQLLVYGYIKEIQDILRKDDIIPLDVIQLCILFYSLSMRIFYAPRYDKSIYSAKDGSVIRIKPRSSAMSSPFEHVQCGCYIPNITSYMKMESKQTPHDGIITIDTKFLSTVYVFDPGTFA